MGKIRGGARLKEGRLKILLLVLGAALLLVFCLFPFIWMLVVSLSREIDLLSSQVSFSLTWGNYREVLSNSSLPFVSYLKNSLVVSSISAVLATSLASLAAYAITRLRFPGRTIIPVGTLALSMFPQICIVGYLFRLMTKLGWINTFNALIFPYIAMALPLALWIMLSYFSQLPRDLDKAALVDGASRFQALRKVIFPIATPGVFSTFLLVFIFCFNEFLFALMLTVDQNSRTVPVGIALFQGTHGQIPWGSIMAAAVVASVPMVLLVAIFQKPIVGGLTRGALKA
jgi:multiple sugar transport system permease protein